MTEKIVLSTPEAKLGLDLLGSLVGLEGVFDLDIESQMSDWWA